MQSSKRWSARTQWDTSETPWAQHLARLRAAGATLWDLTASNPTRCGFSYNPSEILGPLSNLGSMVYEPEPKGLYSAREAVSFYYRDHGAEVDPNHIFLTTSTSEAYSFLFRLLCDPGDEVLIGQPGYPLFDFLAQLDDIRLIPYQLFYDHGWHLDLDALRRRITPRTRAITLVHPNNPTGHFTRAAERTAIEDLCREHNLALIVDEVFLDYGILPHEAQSSFATGSHPVPTFVLSGISKIAALPQMKAAWIACFADDAPDRLEVIARLDVIADTFLSMNAPIQHALPFWLQHRGGLQQQIQDRVAANIAALDTILSRQSLVTRLTIEAGWYAVLRVPELQPQEQTALDLLLKRRVAVHSGGFFGFSGEGWLVVSLLGQEKEVERGLEEVCSEFS
jgi:alanine-synthesizing transaminase